MKIENIDYFIFDLDGVITNTAKIHAISWKETFDKLFDYLGCSPFDIDFDYQNFFDGVSRDQAIENFLVSKNIFLKKGNKDEISIESKSGLSNLKNSIFFEKIERINGEDIIYKDTFEFIKFLNSLEKKIFLASSSKNAIKILTKINLLHFFNSVYDGNTVELHKLRSKPSPDIFNFCINQNEISKNNVIIFEDSISGIEAALNSYSEIVIGIDRKFHYDLSNFNYPNQKKFKLINNFSQLNINK